MHNRYYKGPVTDHFDGVRFFHPGLPSSDKSLLDILKWMILGQRASWPKSVPAKAGLRPTARVEGLQITHIGHASYLVQTNNQNILVDPVWAERTSPMTWAGPRRHNPPAIAFEDLPPIDAVLVTHNHYDHMDTAVLGRLWKTYRPRIFAPLGNDTIIRAFVPGVEVQTGDWWTARSLSEAIRVTIVPAYHWSSRRIGDTRMALWGGFIIETPAGVVYCAGDTAYRDEGAIFKEIGNRFGPPLVAMLPIGAYAPRWFMQTQHANPHEAVRIAKDCGAKQLLGVHWGTFPLTDEPFDEPPEHLEAAVRAKSLEDTRFTAMRPGDTWTPIQNVSLPVPA
jgi:L-ascorbate metabolism protein UlaG (beta-lactamase superfamily)